MSQFEGFIPWKKTPDNSDGNSHFSHNDPLSPFWDNDQTFAPPAWYDIYILNDPNTPKECMVSVIQKFFHKSTDDAAIIADGILKSGKGICGTYTKDVAETKIDEIIRFSRENHFVITCMMEKGNKHAI